MSVVHSQHVESHTGAIGSISEASFSFFCPPTAGASGCLVFVVNLVTATSKATAVDWGGVALVENTSARADDTATEPGRVQTFFNGSFAALAARANDNITVTRTNDTDELWAHAVIVGTSPVTNDDTDIYVPGIVLLQNDGTLAEQSVTDGGTGIGNSIRYACAFSGLAAFPPTGANSTALNNFDTGNQTAACVRETTPGTGARSVGFTSATSDDRAVVHLAIIEVTPPSTPVDPTGFAREAEIYNPALARAIQRIR